MAVLDAQHLLAIGIVAAGFAPQVGRLDGRHQHFDGAGPVLLLAHDLLDLLQHAEAQRQPGVAAGRFLADHAGAQHERCETISASFGSSRRMGMKYWESRMENPWRVEIGGSFKRNPGELQGAGIARSNAVCRHIFT